MEAVKTGGKMEAMASVQDVNTEALAIFGKGITHVQCIYWMHKCQTALAKMLLAVSKWQLSDDTYQPTTSSLLVLQKSLDSFQSAKSASKKSFEAVAIQCSSTAVMVFFSGSYVLVRHQWYLIQIMMFQAEEPRFGLIQELSNSRFFYKF